MLVRSRGGAEGADDGDRRARIARSISSPGTGDTAPRERRRLPPSRRVRLVPGPGQSASRTATTELTVTASGVGLDHQLRDHTVNLTEQLLARGVHARRGPVHVRRATPSSTARRCVWSSVPGCSASSVTSCCACCGSIPRSANRRPASCSSRRPGSRRQKWVGGGRVYVGRGHGLAYRGGTRLGRSGRRRSRGSRRRSGQAGSARRSDCHCSPAREHRFVGVHRRRCAPDGLSPLGHRYPYSLVPRPAQRRRGCTTPGPPFTGVTPAVRWM